MTEENTDLVNIGCHMYMQIDTHIHCRTHIHKLHPTYKLCDWRAVPEKELHHPIQSLSFPEGTVTKLWQEEA